MPNGGLGDPLGGRARAGTATPTPAGPELDALEPHPPTS